MLGTISDLNYHERNCNGIYGFVSIFRAYHIWEILTERATDVSGYGCIKITNLIQTEGVVTFKREDDRSQLGHRDEFFTLHLYIKVLSILKVVWCHETRTNKYKTHSAIVASLNLISCYVFHSLSIGSSYRPRHFEENGEERLFVMGWMQVKIVNITFTHNNIVAIN